MRRARDPSTAGQPERSGGRFIRTPGRARTALCRHGTSPAHRCIVCPQLAGQSRPPAAATRLSACTDLDVAGHCRSLEIAQIRVCCRSDRPCSWSPRRAIKLAQFRQGVGGSEVGALPRGARQALFPLIRCDQWEWSLSGREWSLSRCWAAARLCFSVPPDTGVVSVRAICSSIAMREGSRLQASAPLLRCPGCSRRPHVGQAGAAAPGLHEEGCRGSPHGSVGPVGTIPLAQHDTTLFKGLTASAHCLHGSRNRDIGSRLTGMRWLRACADDPGKARSKTASLARGWKLNRMRMLRHLVGCSLRAQRGSQPSALACRLCTYRRAGVSVTAVVSG